MKNRSFTIKRALNITAFAWICVKSKNSIAEDGDEIPMIGAIIEQTFEHTEPTMQNEAQKETAASLVAWMGEVEHDIQRLKDTEARARELLGRVDANIKGEIETLLVDK